MPLKAPKLHQAALAVQLPSQPTQATCASLVQAVLKHLLYARGHIPYLFDQLLQQALEEQEEQEQQQGQDPGQPRGRRRRTRPKKSDKRRLQFLQRAVALFDTITPELFATNRPTRCFLLLGASTSRPREAYELLLPAAAPVSEELSAAAGAARADYACRVLLRQLISSALDLPEGTAAEHPGKVYFLMQAAPSQEALGFSPKPSFRLAMRRGVHVTLSLGAAWVQQQQQGQPHQAAEASNPETRGVKQAAESKKADKAVTCGEGSVQASQEAGEQGGSVWLQSKWVLRGLKCNSDAPMG
ncbi:hypothetical protein N2152v2_003660 [Parachlorella kessleri]